jgi:hypothetical protein
MPCCVADTPSWPRIQCETRYFHLKRDSGEKPPAVWIAHLIRIHSPGVRVLYSLVAEGRAEFSGCFMCWSGQLDKELY